MAAVCRHALGAMVLFRKRVYTALRARAPGLQDEFVGDELRLPESLPPGEVCRMEIRGSTWQVRNTGSALIPAGGKARVTAVAGIGLHVEASQ
jgi:membrane protein implicated in regulation of membrane protease activity